jgi:hypothetical protein
VGVKAEGLPVPGRRSVGLRAGDWRAAPPLRRARRAPSGAAGDGAGWLARERRNQARGGGERPAPAGKGAAEPKRKPPGKRDRRGRKGGHRRRREAGRGASKETDKQLTKQAKARNAAAPQRRRGSPRRAADSRLWQALYGVSVLGDVHDGDAGDLQRGFCGGFGAFGARPGGFWWCCGAGLCRLEGVARGSKG